MDVNILSPLWGSPHLATIRRQNGPSCPVVPLFSFFLGRVPFKLNQPKKLGCPFFSLATGHLSGGQTTRLGWDKSRALANQHPVAQNLERHLEEGPFGGFAGCSPAVEAAFCLVASSLPMRSPKKEQEEEEERRRRRRGRGRRKRSPFFWYQATWVTGTAFQVLPLRSPDGLK